MPNPAAVVDRFSVRRTVRIQAPVTKVWAAITEPRHLSVWLGAATLDNSDIGGRGSLTWPDRGPVPFRVESADPPRSISFRWSNDENAALPPTVDESRSTVFTFTLVPVDGGTELTVVETGFEQLTDPPASLQSHRRGWDVELDELVSMMEGA